MASTSALFVVGCESQRSSATVVPHAAVGNQHCLMLTQGGQVFGAGLNNRGQLGILSSDVQVKKAEKVTGLDLPLVVDVGNAHSVVLQKNGRVMTFGDNRYGQLGGYALSFSATPRVVKLPERITSLASGGAHVIAMSERKAVYGWGSNFSMQLGQEKGQFSGIPVKLVSRAKAIAAYSDYTAILSEEGKLMLWGAGTKQEQCCWPGATQIRFHEAQLQVLTAQTVTTSIPIQLSQPAVKPEIEKLCRLNEVRG